LRGPEVGPKEPNELRVLALGDSLVYGQGVADDETLPAYLQAELAAAQPERPVTVINGGHRAYATHQELGLLRELGPELAPDVVVVFWYWNDILERDIERTFEHLSETGPAVFDVKGRMEGWTRRKWQLKQLVRRSALAMWAYDLLPQLLADGEVDYQPGELDAAMARLAGYLDGFESVCRELSCELRFAIIPDPASLRAPHYSLKADARARELLEQRGIPLIDLRTPLAALAQETDGLPIIPFDWHYLPEGTRVQAAAGAAALR
jgi:hypothetical protein